MSTRLGCNELRIEFCGGIASGKTTLATLFEDAGIEPLYEQFQENPFWRAFYEEPYRYSFETEITFLLQHYHQIKSSAGSKTVLVCDFSFLLDRAYAEVTLDGPSREAFQAVYNKAKSDLPSPTLVVYLQCSPETELERIRRRARAVEEQITIDYLEAINRAVKKQVVQASGQFEILSIDSDARNFAEDSRVQQQILDEVFHLIDMKGNNARKII